MLAPAIYAFCAHCGRNTVQLAERDGGELLLWCQRCFRVHIEPDDGIAMPPAPRPDPPDDALERVFQAA